jgi:holdfast attachment protein HfaA
MQSPKTLHTKTPHNKKTLMAVTLFISTLTGVAMTSEAQAQSMGASAASYESGYGATLGKLQTAVDPSTRDANGNRVILDGVMLTGSDNSVYARGSSGAGDSYSGAGALGGASAIGNNLQVTVNGSHNTLVINSTQINNGNITASNNLTGQKASSDTSLNGNLSGF